MTSTHLTWAVDFDGLSAEDAFAILGNETRLAVIRILWQADAVYRFDDGSTAARSMSYSTLQERIGVEDNGRFNYHLSKLTPHFIRRADDGYRLSSAGKRIARTVVAASGPEAVEVEANLGDPCPLCGGTVTITYEDQWLRVQCADCDGLFGDEAPAGSLFLTQLPNAGMADRADDTLQTALYRCVLDITFMMGGICRECAGPTDASLSVCESHEGTPGESCPGCGTPHAVWADLRCQTCGFAKRLPAAMFVVGLAPVVGFLQTEGIDLTAPTFEDAMTVMSDHVETTPSPTTGGAKVTIHGSERSLDVDLDEEMNVTDISASAA